MNVSLNWENDGTIERVAAILQAGEAVLGTTDTVPGLFALATPKGQALLDTIKGRSGKPYIVLISDQKTAQRLTHPARREALRTHTQKYWPGPHTVVVPTSNEVHPALGLQHTIALRVPDHDPIRKLIQLVGPLLSTSANKAGAPYPQRIDQVDPLLIKSVTLIVRSTTEKESLPSSMVSLIGSEPIVLRVAVPPAPQP